MAIELFTSATPNGHKVSIALEELGVPYTTTRVDISAQEQFRPAFLSVSPNGKIPAIVDRGSGAPVAASGMAGVGGGVGGLGEGMGGGKEPGFAVFESGAILMYLAERSGGRLLPPGAAGRWEALQWVMFQMANLGPMLGQSVTFERFMPERVPAAIARYHAESRRLLEVA